MLDVNLTWEITVEDPREREDRGAREARGAGGIREGKVGVF